MTTLPTQAELLAEAGFPTEATQAEITQKINECISLINSTFGVAIKAPKVKYDLKGHTAGQARYSDNTIRINLPLYLKNRDDMLHNTVPHELAHIAAYQLFKTRFDTRQAKAHGKEWQMVMRVLGLEATRCHEYETTPVRSYKPRARPFSYRCDCREHKVTALIHRRMQEGQKRICMSCRARLRFSE